MRRTTTTTTRHARHQPLMMGMTTGVPRPPAEPDLLSMVEVSQRLNVSRTTIWRLAKRGEIRTVRIGSRTLIPRTELLRLIGGGAEGSQ